MGMPRTHGAVHFAIRACVTAQSICQRSMALPDFRNLGVMTRILLGVNLLGMLAGLLRAGSVDELVGQLAYIATVLEPALLASLVVLNLANGVLRRLPYAAAIASLTVVVALIAWGVALGLRMTGLGQVDPAWSSAYAVIAVLIFAGYFSLWQRAHSPALAEARLQALQARIRPHFLFNCINAVLSMIRRDPRRAESALEDLAELFRSVMTDTRNLIPFAEELQLTRRYLDLEHLRLGERLRVEWRVDPACDAVRVPPMLLQPLVENAVYHGIEPGAEPGTIEIAVRLDGEQLLLELVNPYWPEHQHRQGNRMALANIGERLMLHYDVEATLHTEVEGTRYRTRITLPLRGTNGART